jgi:tetratricopeptide (TPR) repeat protein
LPRIRLAISSRPGLQQLEAARTGFSDAAYQKAEDTLTKALEQNPSNARALIHRGEARMARVGILAAQSKFGPASELAQTAMADMDRAVSLAPKDLDVRLTRGFTYSAFPAYYDKAAIAREDLQIATRDPQFASLAKDLRSHALQALGVAYTNLSELEKALESFRSMEDAIPGRGIPSFSGTGTICQAHKEALEAAHKRPGLHYRDKLLTAFLELSFAKTSSAINRLILPMVSHPYI